MGCSTFRHPTNRVKALTQTMENGTQWPHPFFIQCIAPPAVTQTWALMSFTSPMSDANFNLTFSVHVHMLANNNDSRMYLTAIKQQYQLNIFKLWHICRDKRKYDINPELLFQLHEGDRRGHDQKLFKIRFWLNVRKYAFSNSYW